MNYHPPSMPEDWDTIALGSSCDNVTDTCCSSNHGRTAAEGGPGHQYAVAVAEQYAIDAAGDARTEMSGGQLEYTSYDFAHWEAVFMQSPDALPLPSTPHGAGPGHLLSQIQQGSRSYRNWANDEPGNTLDRRSPGQYVQSWLAEDVSLSPSVRDYPCAIAPPLSANIPRSDADALTAHSGNQTVALCPTTAATASRAASPLALSPSYPIQQTWQPAPGTYYASPHVYQPPPPPAYAPQALPPPPPTYAPPPPPQNAPAQLVPADLQLDRAIEDPICGLEGCSIRLDDLTVGGQRRHLRDFHAAELQHGRVQCTWVYDSGTMCGRDLDKNNWGKHIAAVHYGSTAEQCPYCPKVICRPDALRRHVDNFHSRADED